MHVVSLTHIVDILWNFEAESWLAQCKWGYPCYLITCSFHKAYLPVNTSYGHSLESALQSNCFKHVKFPLDFLRFDLTI